MANPSDNRILKACKKLNEFRDLLRQNFAPAPESADRYNDCIDMLIEAGVAADHYKVNRDNTSAEFLGKLQGALQAFCESPPSPEDTERE
jgi:hypothetical protein